MKNLISILTLILISNYVLSQGFRDHDLDLNGEKFTEISPDHMTDTVNMKQGGGMQWEYIEFNIDDNQANSIRNHIDDCKSIRNIISKFGAIKLDISIMSYSDNITTIRGFYYAIDNIKSTVGFIYPRTDRLIY